MKKMKKMSKRGLALLMSLLMCMSMLNLTAFADEGQATDENTTPAVVEAAPTPETTVEAIPTAVPTEAPVADPTAEPITETEPTAEPTAETEPTAEPTEETEPTASPEGDPTAEPTEQPTEEPADDIEDTQSPADKPTEAPVVEDNEPACICTGYHCSPLVDGKRTLNENCPACSGENGDWHNCKGKLVLADGNPEHEHRWMTDRWYGTVPANCTTPKAWTLVDFDCGGEWLFAFDESTGLDPNTHYFSNYKPTIVPPTCAEAGTSTLTCLLCGEAVVETIPATGIHHLDNSAEITKEATCEEAGERKGNCIECGQEITEEIPALGHTQPENPDEVTTIEPTCTTDGTVTYTCSVCSTDIVETTPATGHKFNTSKVGCQNKGCSAMSYRIRTCDDWDPTTYKDDGDVFCGRVIKEADGTIWGSSDSAGKNPIQGDGITLIDHEGSIFDGRSYMGKEFTYVKNGERITWGVVGWRARNTPNGTLYQGGDVIPFEQAFEMAATGKKVDFYFDAVREVIPGITSSGTEAGSVESITNIPARIECSNGITVECTNLDSMQYIPSTSEENGKWVADIKITVDKSFVLGEGHVDLTEALTAISNKISESPQHTVQPGDRIVYNIYLDNQSGYELTYKENSGFLATELRSTDGPIAGVGFDGNTLSPENGDGFSFAPRRLYNDALKAIVHSTASDAEIGAALRKLGYGANYENDEDITRNCLDEYYLDWTNANRRRKDPKAPQATSLQELTITEFSKLTQGHEGMKRTETCQNLYEAFYYFYYGKVLEYNGVDIYEQMRQYSEGGNIEMNTNIPILLSDPTKPYVLNFTTIAADEANNSFMDTEFGIRIGFDLIAISTSTPTPPPVVVIPTPTPTPTATPTPTPEPTEEPTPTPEPDEEIPDEDVPLGTPKPEPTPEPDEEIPDEDVPLGTPKPEPTPDPDEEIPDPDVPLGPSEPEPTPEPEEEIPDEDVPLANTPKTGDNADIWFLLSVISAAGLVFLGAAEWKKRKGSHGA